MTASESIDFDGRTYVVPGRVLELVRKHQEFTVEAAQEVAMQLEQNKRESIRLLTGLFVYALFRTDLSCRDGQLSWLTAKIGGDSVRPIAVAAAKYRGERNKVLS